VKSSLIRRSQISDKPLDSVSESLLSLDDFLSPSLLAIANGKVYRQDRDNNDEEKIASNGSIDTRTVRWCIFCSEHQAASNATDSSKTNKRSTAESPLPLTTNVVCLIGHACRNVCVGTGGHEENAKVLYSMVFSVTLYHVSNQLKPGGMSATHTMIGKPIKPMMALNTKIGPRM